MGADVVLLEDHKMGGDCLNYGCVPSKALMAAGKQAHAMRSGGRAFGVTPVMPQVRLCCRQGSRSNVIETIAPVDSQERFEGLWRAGDPRIRALYQIRTTVQGRRARVITARRIVMATGLWPVCAADSRIWKTCLI